MRLSLTRSMFSVLLEVFPFTNRMAASPIVSIDALLGSQEAAKQAEIEARMKPVGILGRRSSSSNPCRSAGGRACQGRAGGRGGESLNAKCFGFRSARKLSRPRSDPFRLPLDVPSFWYAP